MFKKKQGEIAEVAEKRFTVSQIAGIIKASREGGVDEINAHGLYIKFQPKTEKPPQISDKPSDHPAKETLTALDDLQNILTDPSAFEKSAIED